LVLIYLRRNRQRTDIGRVLAQIVQPSDPSAGARSLRALKLWERTRTDAQSGSPVLAERFMLDALASVSTEAIERRARRYARFMDACVIIALIAAFALASRAAHPILEGLDVALARRGRAPVAMQWLEVTGASAQPPAYLRMAEHSILFGSRIAEPTGTLVSVRGVPLRNGVALVLTNGQQSVEFVQSADGEVVAHWTLNRSEQLRIAARFGPTMIEQDEAIVIDAEPDEPPEISLENEGQTVQLGRVPRVELNYHAYDDHGLRQIDLVLKSSDREDRRTLMRLDGQQREQTGAHALSAGDSLLKGVRLPTLVRVEARDDNTLLANNWGHSGWVRLEPLRPGQPEAERMQSLEKLRDRLVEWVAASHSSKPMPEREQVLAKKREAALASLAQSLAPEQELWHWPTHVELLLKALEEKLIRAGAQTSLGTTVEQATLALDSVIGDLAERDARIVSVALAELADDVALGARQAGGTEFRDRGERRVTDAFVFLEAGARSLRALGRLGDDLSNIVRATLTRMQRAHHTRDFTHVQLAAEYLAARLRRPEPSAGSSSSTAGVESSSAGAPHLRSAASNAHQRIERLLIELQQLKQEHKANLELLERTLKAAEADALQDAPRADTGERADRLRRLAETLPYMGADPDSSLSSQVVAREQALGAAEAMRRHQNDDAFERVRVARDAIAEALLRGAREDRTHGIDEKGLRLLDQELANEARRLEQTLQEARRDMGRRAAQQLRDQVGNERQLAGRARSLAQREQRRDAVIPEALRRDLGRAAEFMDLATDALEKSDGTDALGHERRAQALLDRFDAQQKSRAGEGSKDDTQGKASPMTNQGTVTPTGDPEAAARFRSRVQMGLSTQAPGELGSAVRRYAEGLLR
jgi:hypothetical protein